MVVHLDGKPGNPLLVSPDALKTGTHAGTGPRGRRPPSLADCKFSFFLLVIESGVVEQVALRRGPFRRELCLGIGGFPLAQMCQYLPDHRRVFDAGDNPYRPLTLLAGFDVDLEDPFQALGPCHGGVTFGRRSVIRVESVLVLVASPAPPRWRDGGTDISPALLCLVMQMGNGRRLKTIKYQYVKFAPLASNQAPFLSGNWISD